MAFKCTSVAAAAILVLLAVSLTVPASASTLTVFKGGPGCAGKTKDIMGCGCFSLEGYQNGYHFVFTEKQEAILYKDNQCSDDYKSEVLAKEKRSCREYGYNSVRLICY